MKKIDKQLLRHMVEVQLLTQGQIADHFQCALSSVERMSKRMGLVTQRTGPRSGSGHPEWKGGRILIGNYWYIYSPSHPNRTKQNRVAEHRLVMEQKLGRYLLRSEVVHHADGNPQNNSPDNLHVFQSNASHLRQELSGRVPNWTPEGLANISEGLQKRTNQLLSGVGAPQRNQTTGRWTKTPGSTK